MKDYLKLYQEYYNLRLKRYEGNEEYTNSYHSEKAIYEAIVSCSNLEEFKEKLGNLNEENAVALMKDQYTIRHRHYEEINQPLKAASCKRILERAAQAANSTELMSIVYEEEHRLMLELTADSIHPFDDFTHLENMEVWGQADVPEKYKGQYQQFVQEEENRIRERYRMQQETLQKFVPGWKFSFEKVMEDRHRRLLPFPDDVIHKNISNTKKFLLKYAS